MAPTPTHGGPVLDPASGRKREARRIESGATQDLGERNEAIEQAGLVATDDLRTIGRELDDIGLRAEVVVKAAVNRVAAFLIVTHQPLAGKQELRQRRKVVGNDFAGTVVGHDGETSRHCPSSADIHRMRPGND